MKKIAMFWTAWGGEGADSFFGVFRTQLEAKAFKWVDKSYKVPWLRKPRGINLWFISLDYWGNPIIQRDSTGTRRHERRGHLCANLPIAFWGEDSFYGDMCVPVGIPIRLGRGNDMRLARAALISYFEEYSGK